MSEDKTTTLDIPEERMYVSVEEAAMILGVNYRQVFRMIKSGNLKAKDINASNKKRHIWRILKSDLTTPDKIK